jgi:hypothetical protein
MLAKTNRATGEPFLGCSRFPDCRGTRPMTTGRSSTKGINQPRPRYRLSTGGRARTLPDAVELLVDRAIGRNLSPIQGCAVQIAAVVVVGFAIWAFYASGLAMQIIEPIVEWYTSQIQLGPSPAPSP